MNCTDTIHAPPALHAGPAGRFAQALGRLYTRLLEWQDRSEQRAHLAGMDERMRKDIGITYADAVHEADKPFWRP